MNRLIISTILLIILQACQPSARKNQVQVNDQGIIAITTVEGIMSFAPNFIVLYAEEDPKPAMRPAGIEDVQYNVVTWEGNIQQKDRLQQLERKEQQAGDGFDKRILEGKVKTRTANLFAAGKKIVPILELVERQDGKVIYHFEKTKYGQLKAWMKREKERPVLHYEFSATKPGYYSIGYLGAPAYPISEVNEIWQPLIWQEKRFPEQSYMTLAYRCPLPTTLVTHNNVTFGVIAHPDEFPFDPLPLKANSRFGVAVRNAEEKAQPMLFAPVLGGTGSEMKPGNQFNFKVILWAGQSTIPQAYEFIAEGIYGFKDYRHNGIASLNETLENMVDYSLSEYAGFVDSLKGWAYSTDVPGAVKNVSSLNPLSLALVMNDKKMYEERAYPIVEYMLSREKFLFSLDPKQKIQNPSREMKGPIAPVTELVALYNITGRANPFLLKLAKEEYNSSRIRNLDVKEIGKTWKNALALYQATGNMDYLEAAKQGADEYIQRRIETPQTDFNEPDAGGVFFWTGFAPKWIDLLELYEETGEERYLQAAHEGARHYAMFCWMSPKISNDSILVNEGGKTPMYWYLRNKGHKQMYIPEEWAPAWHLSAIGLTPESSGTSTGHRAIFMANYAPWMLRLGYYTKDRFLMNIAKAAIIGRYRNFPGYHINTARTTIYEKKDYPLKPHKQLSVNSFHYNHILPMAVMLLDYLVTDVFVRSKGEIYFPSAYIEGYAYLQNKFYGHKPGQFYGEEAWLWMPKDLLKSSSVELNYIVARSENNLLIAFTNQSDIEVESVISLNNTLLPLFPEKELLAHIWINNQPSGKAKLYNGKLKIKVLPDGITAIKIKDIQIKPSFQQALTANVKPWSKGYAEVESGDTRAMIIQMGNYETNAYVYLRKDDKVYRKVTLEYTNELGETKRLTDVHFPYEFTISLDEDVESFSFTLHGKTVNGEDRRSEKVELYKHDKI